MRKGQSLSLILVWSTAILKPQTAFQVWPRQATHLEHLVRESGLRYLGVEPCSVELYLLMAKNLVLPQTSPRFTKKSPHASPDHAPKSMGWPDQHKQSNHSS